MRLCLLQRRAAALALALLLAVPALPARAATRQQELQQRADQAREDYEEATRQQEDAEQQIDSTQETISSIEGRVSEVEAQLSSVYTALQQARAELDAANGEAEAARNALAAKQAEFDARMEVARDQLLAMQQLQSGGGIQLLSQVSNLFQLLTFDEVLESLTARNDQLLSELNDQAARLDAQRQAAEAAAEQARLARARLEENQAALNATSGQLATALQDANSALTRQQAEAQALAQVTEEARRAYQQATAELDAYARQQNDRYSTPDLTCSLDFGPALAAGTRISCNYGDPDGIDGSHHNGTDFPAAGGTPIYAVADGVVSAARSMPSYGNCVQISHGTADDGRNYATLYAHMSSFTVSEGQTVTKGQVIGYVGNTGDVVGANGGYHLHLELRINGSRTNAMQYIPH